MTGREMLRRIADFFEPIGREKFVQPEIDASDLKDDTGVGK